VKLQLVRLLPPFGCAEVAAEEVPAFDPAVAGGETGDELLDEGVGLVAGGGVLDPEAAVFEPDHQEGPGQGPAPIGPPGDAPAEGLREAEGGVLIQAVILGESRSHRLGTAESLAEEGQGTIGFANFL